jgi:CheY-like chemotaxis protein
MSTIVIFEEDELMQKLLVEWLSAEGYCVQASAPGMSPWPENRADLVIVDLVMPRQEGGTRLQAIKSRFPQAPVLAVSGQFRPGLDGSPHAAKALGVGSVIAKPFSRADLLTAVHCLVGPAR